MRRCVQLLPDQTVHRLAAEDSARDMSGGQRVGDAPDQAVAMFSFRDQSIVEKYDFHLHSLGRCGRLPRTARSNILATSSFLDNHLVAFWKKGTKLD
jgi:hypothetical protein